MARDSRNALVALNRFGFGARGGASGDFVNAASDPRGFVKADLARPTAVLLEVPGLQSTPELAKAVFEYQFEQQQARAAAAKSARAGAKARRNSRKLRRSPNPQHARPVARQCRAGHLAEGAGRAACRPIAARRDHGAGGDDAAQRHAVAKAGAAATQRDPEDVSRRGAGAAAARQRWSNAALPSGSWCSGPIISASPPTRAGWRGCGPARSSARRSAPMCSAASPTC